MITKRRYPHLVREDRQFIAPSAMWPQAWGVQEQVADQEYAREAMLESVRDYLRDRRRPRA